MATIKELFELAVRYHQSGNLRQAEALYRQVLQAEPAHAAAHHMLGRLAHQSGQHQLAIAMIRQAVALNPADAVAHYNLGVILKHQGQLAQAVESFEQALRLDPNRTGAYNNLGNACCEQKRYAEAEECYRQAMRINPHEAETYNNLATALQEQGRHEEAVSAYRHCLLLEPNYAEVYSNLGNVLMELGQFAEAIACCRHALDIKPRHADAYHNLSAIDTRMGRFCEAVEHNEAALLSNPTHERALWQRSRLRLTQGDFEGSWQRLPTAAPRSSGQPPWDGSPLEGRTILVYAEQGMGDTILFARYLPLVKQRGGMVLLECQPALARVLAGAGLAEQVISHGEKLPFFDVQIPLLRLPAIFSVNLQTVPADVPYLRADAALLEHWKTELEPIGGFKVGIAWQGNPKNDIDRYRSIPLAQFEILARIEGIQILSLQVGPGTNQLATIPFPVTDLGKRFDPSSMADLAAVLMNLDLVVTVDSAVAHLAGALGAAVWTLPPVCLDWRYMMESSVSPWYATMRLFRPSALGKWDDVLERVAAEIRANISEPEAVSDGNSSIG